MDNASLNTTGPNMTYTPSARVGSVDPRIGSVTAFGNQHVGIGKEKVSRGGYYPTLIIKVIRGCFTVLMQYYVILQ